MADKLSCLVNDMITGGVPTVFLMRMLDLYQECAKGMAEKASVLEARQVAHRSRQQAYRERKVIGDITEDDQQKNCNVRKRMPRRARDITKNQLSFLLPLNNSNSSPLKGVSEGSSSGEVYTDAAREGFVGNRRVDFSRGYALPEDWRPTIDQYEYGTQLGLSRAEIDSAAEDMRIWAGANRNRAVARKADWNLTFKGWLRRVAQKLKRNGSGGSAFDVSRDLERMIDEGGTSDEPITRGAGAVGYR